MMMNIYLQKMINYSAIFYNLIYINIYYKLYNN
jgi:hypothetical protein